MVRNKEIWPFHDDACGGLVFANRFYGFGDSGFRAGDFDGYLTREEAVDKIQESYYLWRAADVITTNPEELGEYCIAVLSGREYVDQLYKTLEGSNETLEEVYGHWSEDEPTNYA